MSQSDRTENGCMKGTLLAAYQRNLGVLKTEIESYEDEANIWRVEDGITNSGGNLCLHLVGNLNHFVGAVLGNTGYVRDRNLEFSDKGLSRQELLDRIEDVRDVIADTMAVLKDESLQDDYPEVLFDEQMSTGTVLAYMSGHLAYHLGQVNYHRRLLDK